MTAESFQTRLAARMSAMNHSLAIQTERAVNRAARRLGLRSVKDRLDSVMASAMRGSPLYAAQCVIHGQTCRDMYDEHPGFAYFYTFGALTVDLTTYRHIEDARMCAVEIWKGECRDRDDDDEEWDGKFVVGNDIVLLDQFGRPIDEFDGERWCHVEPQSNWPAMHEQIRALRSEASFESGWDNFSTAEDLRREADKLERALEISKLRPRLIT